MQYYDKFIEHSVKLIRMNGFCMLPFTAHWNVPHSLSQLAQLHNNTDQRPLRILFKKHFDFPATTQNKHNLNEYKN